MADTLKFGPEWLRQLSDGNSVASPPPTPGLGSKFKIAEYRYGREEMLALFHNNYKAPDDLVNYPPVYVEDSQKPLALISLTEEEQRLMSQSVNSTTVLRSMGRGGQPVRGGRGGGDRGRGRGRGRGDVFPPRGGTFDPAENGGYGRSRGQNKDGWEEVGKKYDRSFSNRNHEEGLRHPQFSRSLSSDNWREKDDQLQEDEGGDWRRAGPQKDRWGPRSNWRDPMGRGGFDGERRPNGPIKDRTRTDADDKHHVYRRSRSSESWDTDDLPEWSVTGDDDMEELGTFDASGAFVTSHPRVMRNGESPSSESPTSQPQTDPVQLKEPPREQRKEKKLPRPTSAPDVKQSASNHGNSHSNSPQTVKNDHDHNRNDPSKSVQFGDVSQIANNSSSIQMEQKVDSNSMSQVLNLPGLTKVNSAGPVAESEALSRLKEAAENMVAEMTAEQDDENKTSRVAESRGQGVPLNHEHSMKWFYKDPQGDVQGPFNPEEMAQWFSAGYFTMSLLVKRGCDEKFQQLGELIKRWGRVPFLAGPSPPPLLNNPGTSTEAPVKPTPPPPPPQPTPPQQDLMGMIPQQFLLQQLMQQQMLMRNMQVQMMAQLQEQESFKSLSPPQQQQLVMQMLMQTQPVFMQQMQQLQQLQQQQQQQQQNRLSPQPQSEGAPPAPHPAYSRSVSQPVPAESEVPPPGTQGNWSQPSSVWDLEAPASDMSPNSINQQHLEKLQAQQKAEEARRKQEEEERRQQLEIQRTQEELKRQQEEIAREREKMLREKEELERQRQIELKRLEEIRRREDEERRRQIEEELKREEEKRREEKRRQEEELAAHRVEEARRKEQEERRRAEEERRRQEELHKKQIEEERRKQEILRQQEIQRQQEELKLQQKREEEEHQREMMRQQEMQRQEQQRQQQEALRRLQQQQREQLARMQLPPTAQWANQPAQRDSNEGKSLSEIQQEEERQSQERERQLEFQRQQMIALQQQEQQQQQHLQKSWGSQMTVNQVATSTLKSLLDIQEEQAKQTDQNKKKNKQVQPTQPKQVPPASTLTTPSMWSNVASNGAQSTGWGGNTVWGSDKSSPGGIGFWDEAVITSRKAATKDSGEFPALGGKKRNQQVNNNSTSSAMIASNRNKQTKQPKKEEDTVQKLFQCARPVDDFTQWCEKALTGLASSVDVPTFIAFLQEVESPYEVHDYVRSYLGESGAAKEFGRQFLEKRSHYKQKARLERQQEEDSIWGPAPAVNPKETRTSNNNDFDLVARNKNKKKKGKMQKVDKSILGFTVHADPTRVNAGEIDNVD